MYFSLLPDPLAGGVNDPASLLVRWDRWVYGLHKLAQAAHWGLVLLFWAVLSVWLEPGRDADTTLILIAIACCIGWCASMAAGHVVRAVERFDAHRMAWRVSSEVVRVHANDRARREQILAEWRRMRPEPKEQP